jgi:hypothetical protein
MEALGQHDLRSIGGGEPRDHGAQMESIKSMAGNPVKQAPKEK